MQSVIVEEVSLKKGEFIFSLILAQWWLSIYSLFSLTELWRFFALFRRGLIAL